MANPESVLRLIPPGRWVQANGHDRRALKALVADGLLLTCRRYYLGRPGRPCNLYRLTALGEMAAFGRVVTGLADWH